MKYIVYQTTNLINNKIYIGVHQTIDPNYFDSYYGCGLSAHNNYYYLKHPYTPFQYAVAKYGLKNFKRTTLAIFDTAKEALELETKLVNIDFIKRKDTYNVALGGNYGNYLFPINQFDKNGSIIKIWDNCAIAAETLGVSEQSINAAKLHKSSCLGYFWSDKTEIDPNEFTYKIYKRTYKYNLDGKLVGIFETMSEAASEINESPKKLSRAILSNLKCGGYYYSYTLYDEYIPKKLSLKGKILHIYELDGTYIKSLPCGPELKAFYNTQSYTNLKQAILQNRPFKDTQVSLEKVDKMLPCTNNSNKSKKIGRYDLENNLLEKFNSIRDAIKKYGQGVSRVLKGQQEKTKGFIFKFID